MLCGAFFDRRDRRGRMPGRKEESEMEPQAPNELVTAKKVPTSP